MQHNLTVTNTNNFDQATQIVDDLCGSIFGLTSGGQLGYNMFIDARSRAIIEIAQLLA